MDGSHFNITRSRSRTLTNHIWITELQYTDDNSTLAHTIEDLQTSADKFFSRAYTQCGLNINKAKTNVLLLPCTGQETFPEDTMTIR